jgi:ABC-type transporter MlaC component
MKRLLISLIMVSTICGAHTKTLEADSAAIIKNFVNNVTKIDLIHLTQSGLVFAEKQKRFRAFLKKRFNNNKIASYCLSSRYFKKSSDLLTRYQSSFEDHMVLSYINLLDKYAGQVYVIESMKQIGSYITVIGYAKDKAGVKYPINWRLYNPRNKKVSLEHLRIVDMVVLGSSMASIKRSEFKSILQNCKNDVSCFVTALEAQNKKLQDRQKG